MKPPKETWALVGGLFSAFVASLCCLGPLIAVGLGIGSFAAASWISHGRPYFLAATFGLLALAWYLTYRRPRRAGSSGATGSVKSSGRASKVALWIGTALALPIAAFSWFIPTGAIACAECADEKSPGDAHARASTCCEPVTVDGRSNVAAANAPWESVDPAFAGCAGPCGTRVAGGLNDAAVQPGAKLDQQTYCPVSGVVFRVTASSPHRELGTNHVYLCCEACAAYFSLNRERVLAARGI